jgi:hypothetical protein
MRDRKRRNLRPSLEMVESRVVLSTVGHLAHHAEVVAAHVNTVNRAVAKADADARENSEALARLQLQEQLIHARSLEHRPSALPSAAEQRASQISNIFGSIGKSI